MAFEVKYSKDPNLLFNDAEEYLISDPVHNNLVLTLLKNGINLDNVGGYWTVNDTKNVVGVCVQPSINSRGIITSMPIKAVQSLVEEISKSNIRLSGIGGEINTVGIFAGEWAEKNKTPVIPFLGLRLYKLDSAKASITVKGHIRKATMEDRDILIDWVYDFTVESGEYQENSDPDILEKRRYETSQFIDLNILTGNVWLYGNPNPVSMVIRTPDVYGVVRLEKVYTPPEQRNKGYATACVSHISNQIQDEGYRCILYSDLNNPVSNSIYRKIGYNAIAEIIQYRFE